MLVVLVTLGLLLVPLCAWLILPDPERPRRSASRVTARDLPRVEAEVEDEPEEVEPPPAPREEPEAPPPEPDEITGMVTSGEGVVPSAMVTCTRRNGEELMAAAAGDGRFRFPLDWDGCTAVARSSSHGASAAVELRRGAENRLDLPAQGGIAGTVTDERGLPVTTFLVALDHAVLADGSRAPGAMQRKFDDAEGRFTLERMGAGRWTLLVSAAGRPQTKVEVPVEPGKVTDDVRVRLERGATLLGSVVDRVTRRPIGGATVTLDDGARESAIEPATTSPGGEFRLEGVPAGAFGVEVAHPDYLARIVSGLDARGQRQLRTTIDLAPSTDGGGRLEMSGIGASLNSDPDGRVHVTSVREDGPAEHAGMLADDVITAIDGKSAEGMSVQDCVQLLRGPAGTEVRVTVRRGDAAVDMTIVRDVLVR